MNKRYYTALVVLSCFNILWLLSFIFATGRGNGIKLDDNQLPGYIIICLCLCILTYAYFVNHIQLRKIIIAILALLDALFVFLAWGNINIINFNEGMFIFIGPIYLLIIICIFCIVDFYLSTYKNE
ncbi:TPA_asm: hypothetical protein GF805_12625 [Listeria monocytogenes]|nr:hypothetical protein CXL08_01845 [Listeria monocytogenes]EEW14542.1 predicted protein [Listeria monocytogenes FSL N3-165]EAC7982452.1 hypothetical protein [Listeria monocytogenes]EAD1583792.1 hypothetical protein [Listeria monocytogenes]EAD2540908.1 hypothetical protein [Listeria monocytogenes]